MLLATCEDYSCTDGILIGDPSSITCATTECTDGECCEEAGELWVSCMVALHYFSVFLHERATGLSNSGGFPIRPSLLMLPNGMASVACNMSAHGPMGWETVLPLPQGVKNPRRVYLYRQSGLRFRAAFSFTYTIFPRWPSLRLQGSRCTV